MKIALIYNDDRENIPRLIMQTIAEKIIEHKPRSEKCEIRPIDLSHLENDSDMHDFLTEAKVVIYSGQVENDIEANRMISFLNQHQHHHNAPESAKILAGKYAIALSTLKADDPRNISQEIFDRLERWGVGTIYKYHVEVDVDEPLDIPVEVRKQIEKDIIVAAQEASKQ